MIRLRVDPASPSPDAITEAAHAIMRGGVVAIPTDTLYGLAADPFSPAAVGRVFDIKGRAADQALPLIAADPGQIYDWIGELPPIGFALAEHFWPGPLTLVMRAPLTLDRRITGDRHTVGVRVPDSDVCRALCTSAGRPLTATSANVSGQQATDDPDVVERTLGSQLEVLLDAGRTAGGSPSTLVDITGAAPQLIRAGAIGFDRVLACLRHG